jgi:hypothetical protein
MEEVGKEDLTPDELRQRDERLLGIDNIRDEHKRKMVLRKRKRLLQDGCPENAQMIEGLDMLYRLGLLEDNPFEGDDWDKLPCLDGLPEHLKAHMDVVSRE